MVLEGTVRPELDQIAMILCGQRSGRTKVGAHSAEGYELIVCGWLANLTLVGKKGRAELATGGPSVGGSPGTELLFLSLTGCLQKYRIYIKIAAVTYCNKCLFLMLQR